MNEQKIAPVLSDDVSLRSAAVLGLNALHECIVPKGAETQISDAMRALRSAIDNDTRQQAVLARVGAVRDQALNIHWPVMPPSRGQSNVLFDDGYTEGWSKCLADCQDAIRALKGTPADAEDWHGQHSGAPLCAAALHGKTDGPYVIQAPVKDAYLEEIAEALEDSTLTSYSQVATGIRDLKERLQPSSNPGPLAAVEPSARDEAIQRIDDMVRNQMTKFGLLTRALRLTVGTTLYAMAKDLGMSSATLSGMETGRKPVGPETVREVAAFFRANGLPDLTELLTVAAIAASKEGAAS